AEEDRARRPLLRGDRAAQAERGLLAHQCSRQAARTAAPARDVPRAAADQSHRAGHRACGVGRHHPRGRRRGHAQGCAADLRRVGPADGPCPRRLASDHPEPDVVSARTTKTIAPQRLIRPAAISRLMLMSEPSFSGFGSCGTATVWFITNRPMFATFWRTGCGSPWSSWATAVTNTVQSLRL